MTDLKTTASNHITPKIEGNLDGPAIQQEINDLFSFETEAHQQLENCRLTNQYPTIDLEFLKMRDNNGFPKFAMF